MSINEVMKIGTQNMTQEQINAERERRLKVIEKINQLGDKIARIDIQLKLFPAEYKACKIWRKAKKNYVKQIAKIKADESVWMKEAAWFLY